MRWKINKGLFNIALLEYINLRKYLSFASRNAYFLKDRIFQNKSFKAFSNTFFMFNSKYITHFFSHLGQISPPFTLTPSHHKITHQNEKILN